MVGFGVFELHNESCCFAWVIQLTFGEKFLIERNFVLGIALGGFFGLGNAGRSFTAALSAG
jgi:hypothetical protein